MKVGCNFRKLKVAAHGFEVSERQVEALAEDVFLADGLAVVDLAAAGQPLDQAVAELVPEAGTKVITKHGHKIRFQIPISIRSGWARGVV